MDQSLFDRADQALLACANLPAWRERVTIERPETSLAAWLEALAPHREVVRQMMRYQLQPDHLHLQVQGMVRVSRTVQWWREASCLTSTGAAREVLEVGLTAIYLATVACWLRDTSPASARTRRWLAWQLRVSFWLGQRSLGV